jgi:hypothetical protein
MNMSVKNGIANPISAMPVRAPSAERQDFRALGKALKSGDMSAAKVAYAEVVKDAPEGASVTPGSPFVQLGAALRSGDADAAKAAFSAMIKDARANHGGGALPPPAISLPPTLAPVASTTGGTAGGTLNEVA